MRPGQVLWLPIAAAGSLVTLLALSRIPVVARAVTAPGMASRLVLPLVPGGRGVLAAGLLMSGATPRTAVAPGPASRAR